MTTIVSTTIIVSTAPTMAPYEVGCTECCCTGFRLEYAGPGVLGCIAVTCAGCDGRGWRTPARAEERRRHK